MMIQKRNIPLCLILTIVTCGIYGIFWFYSILNDLYEINGQESTSTMDIILSLITCGLYAMYLNYKMGNLLDSARISKGLAPKESSVLFLILSVFQLYIVNFLIIQEDLNMNFSNDDNNYDAPKYEDYRN